MYNVKMTAPFFFVPSENVFFILSYGSALFLLCNLQEMCVFILILSSGSALFILLSSGSAL